MLMIDHPFGVVWRRLDQVVDTHGETAMCSRLIQGSETAKGAEDGKPLLELFVSVEAEKDGPVRIDVREIVGLDWRDGGIGVWRGSVMRRWSRGVRPMCQFVEVERSFFLGVSRVVTRDGLSA